MPEHVAQSLGGSQDSGVRVRSAWRFSAHVAPRAAIALRAQRYGDKETDQVTKAGGYERDV